MTPAQVAVREYLDAVAAVTRNYPKAPEFAYRSPVEFLLRHGTFWRTAPRPATVRQMTPKMCFDNAFKLAARSRGRYRYVEGVAMSVVPLDHAWAVDADGNVVDPTWETEMLDGVPHDGYFGVVFDLDVVRTVRRRGFSMSVLNDYAGKDCFAVLRSPFDVEAGRPLASRPVGA